MKYTVFLLLSILFPFYAQSQTSIAYSEPFEEPYGQKYLLHLKNGSTIFVNAVNDAMIVKAYNANHKLIATASTKHDVWTDRKFSAATFKGLYDMNGQCVLFMTQLNRGNMLTLHRIIIDPTTAKITKADLIATIPTRRAYGYTLSDLALNDFYIANDAVSGNYAVLLFEGYTADKQDRVKVQVFDNTHKMIKEAVLTEPAIKTKFVHYAGFCMHNNDVFVCINSYDPKSKKTLVPLYLSAFKDGSTSFTTAKIDVRPCNEKSENVLLYNGGKNQIQMLTTTETESDMKGRVGGYTTITKYYSSVVTTIDPQNLSVLSSVPYVTPKADAYARAKLGVNDFNGVFPQMVLNYDNSTTVIASEINSTMFVTGAGYTSKIGIIYLDDNGKEKDAYVLRIPEISSSAYTRGISGGFSTPYIRTTSGDYIIYNDLPENFNKPESVQPHQLTTISDVNTVLLKLANGKPEKSYLFGQPDDKRLSKFSFPGSAVFDKQSSTYITLMVTNDNGKKEAHLAWVKFE